MLQERDKFSTDILSDSNCINLKDTKSFLLRSEDSLINTLFLEFSSDATEREIRKILYNQMKFYMSNIASEWISVMIWEDNINTIITVLPITGAA